MINVSAKEVGLKRECLLNRLLALALRLVAVPHDTRLFARRPSIFFSFEIFEARQEAVLAFVGSTTKNFSQFKRNILQTSQGSELILQLKYLVQVLLVHVS